VNVICRRGELTSCELVICRKGELISRSRFECARSAGDERYIMGEDDGSARRGVPFTAPCDDAASFWSWAAEGSGGLLGIAFEFRWEDLLGVAD
jgi:hypothetical protein